jgi:hypothetical protein
LSPDAPPGKSFLPTLVPLTRSAGDAEAGKDGLTLNREQCDEAQRWGRVLAEAQAQLYLTEAVVSRRKLLKLH